MRNGLRFVALAAALVLVGADTAFTRGYVYSHIGTTFSWIGSAQAWSGSTTGVSCSDWNSYIQNDGTTCTSNTLIGLNWATAHAVNSSFHTPIVANNSFMGGALSPWTSSISGGCSGSPFYAAYNGDEDSDGWYARASSLSCSSTTATITQTVSISGTPTSQTYSFWYKTPAVSAGSAACTYGSGSATIALIINGTTVLTTTANLLGTWTHVSGTTTAFTTGSNTVAFQAVLSAAIGQNGRLIQGEFFCNSNVTAAQPIGIDNVVFSAVW